MIKTIPASTLRNNQASALKALEKEKALLVTRSGRALSALVDLDYFEDLLALSSPKYLNSIRKARADIKAGRFYSHEEVFGKL